MEKINETEVLKFMAHHISYINEVIKNNKKVSERISILKKSGYNVKDCYISDYKGIGYATIVKTKKEVRITIGRPIGHFVREVYAVILPYDSSGEYWKFRFLRNN